MMSFGTRDTLRRQETPQLRGGARAAAFSGTRNTPAAGRSPESLGCSRSSASRAGAEPEAFPLPMPAAESIASQSLANAVRPGRTEGAGALSGGDAGADSTPRRGRCSLRCAGRQRSRSASQLPTV
jgi:hypothetical protein